MKIKTIFLLAGQKGSGKTFIGTIFDKDFQIKFLRVEDWAKKVKKGRHFKNAEYLDEVFKAIENGVRRALKKYPEIVFESTGLTDQFDRMLSNLTNDFNVVTIGVHADSELCINRVKTRDQSIHINISDEQVNAINQRVIKKALKTKYNIQNDNPDLDELKNIISKILVNEVN